MQHELETILQRPVDFISRRWKPARTGSAVWPSSIRQRSSMHVMSPVMERDNTILLDIVRATYLTQSFIGEMTKEQFLADLKTQSAVLHQLMVCQGGRQGNEG